MQFLVDENFLSATVRALQEAGHDLAWVMMIAQALHDGEVIDVDRT